jgi:NADH-quinone oxidoreductase subunit L
VTLLFGAIVGCAKDDIKKALAGSTMSQIGYMILAAGLGPIGYVFAIMHLVTHGFFKAGLFLGAGSIMHAMDDEVDMRKYGGLRRYMPVTFVTFGLGYLAIIGFPGLSGFWTKDKIIEAAFGKGGTEGWILGGAALLGAAITAYYMTRVMLMTFFGERRWAAAPSPAESSAESSAEPGARPAAQQAADPAAAHRRPHPHESPASMTVPMILLAVGSVFAGGLFSVNDAFVRWLEPVTGHAEGDSPLSAGVITAGTLLCLVIGVGLAWAQYGRAPVRRTAPRGSLLTRAARRDLLQDDFNHVALVVPGRHLTRSLGELDDSLVDGAVNGIAAAVGGASARLRRLQNGYARSYAVSMFGGAAVVIAATLLMRGV